MATRSSAAGILFFSVGDGKVNDFWGKQQHYGNGWLGYKRLWAKPSYLS
jgi:hypothetical protein